MPGGADLDVHDDVIFERREGGGDDDQGGPADAAADATSMRLRAAARFGASRRFVFELDARTSVGAAATGATSSSDPTSNGGVGGASGGAANPTAGRTATATIGTLALRARVDDDEAGARGEGSRLSDAIVQMVSVVPGGFPITRSHAGLLGGGEGSNGAVAGGAGASGRAAAAHAEFEVVMPADRVDGAAALSATVYPRCDHRARGAWHEDHLPQPRRVLK